VFFNPIILGRDDTALLYYQWQYDTTEYIDNHGDEKIRRYSDWQKAEVNPETGRLIVHQFGIRKNNEEFLVSLESALSLLGFAEKTAPAALKNVVSAAKTLAKCRLEEQRLLQQEEKNAAITKVVETLPVPRPEIIDRRKENPAIQTFRQYAVKIGIEKIENVSGSDPRNIEEAIKSLTAQWRRGQLVMRGYKYIREDHVRLTRKIASLEKKLAAAGVQPVSPKPGMKR
jgi:hypothetical protein